MDRLSPHKYDGIIDRDAEIKNLLKSIASGIAEVDIIYSKSGVGKSSLVKKLMFQLSENNIPNVILVKTLTLNI